MVKLMLGDCLECMKEIPDNSIDCVCADPPYGTTNCRWDSVIPFAPMWEQLKRIIKPRGAIVLFGSQPFTSALVMSNPGMFKYSWVWEKAKVTGHAASNRRPLKAHEDVCVFADGLAIYNPQKTEGEPYSGTKGATPGESPEFTTGSIRYGSVDGSRYPRTVQRFKDAYYTDGHYHPTQKPVALLSYLVKTYTNEGDMVLDFTFGSCSTGIACLDTGRSFIGIEKDETYFKIGSERMRAKEAEIQNTLFSYDTTDTDKSDYQERLLPAQLQMLDKA